MLTLTASTLVIQQIHGNECRLMFFPFTEPKSWYKQLRYRFEIYAETTNPEAAKAIDMNYFREYIPVINQQMFVEKIFPYLLAILRERLIFIAFILYCGY